MPAVFKWQGRGKDILALLALAGIVSMFGLTQPAAGAVSPHAVYGSTTNLCATCHVSHQAAAYTNLLVPKATPGQLPLCYACHDGSGASTNIKTGQYNSFALSSGHTLEDATSTASADLTNSCTSCHNPHKDYVTRRNLWNSTVNSSTVTGDNNTWCLGCHNDAQSWYAKKGTYPGVLNPSRDASGFPVAGTYPGRSVYASTAVNAHASIPASMPPIGWPGGADQLTTGSCRYCHASHRGPNSYDGLLATFTPTPAARVVSDRTTGNYAALCFGCHDGNASWLAKDPNIANIKRFVTYLPSDNNQNSGHRIKTAGGTLPVGAPLPCYDCHNPHGSSRNNKNLISDALGASLETSTAAGVRRFCLSCHTTSDGQTWDSTATAYVAVSTAATVEGLRRDGTGGNQLKIAVVTNAHSSTDTASCYNCHGNDYSSASSSNVHNPTNGVSAGGIGCYGCHSTYKQYMDSTGAADTTYYHHTLSSLTTAGDISPGSGTYPSETANVYCVSCHTDHNYFNSNKGANLRSGVGLAGSVATNTDFIPGGSPGYGVCISCHSVSQTKDQANQANDGSSKTATITGSLYDVSAHDYQVPTTFGTSTFNANCVKCHDDGQATTFQSGTYTFGTHWSSERRLAAGMGVTVTGGTSASGLCYKCHSTVSNPNQATQQDYYGRSTMTTHATGVNVPFGLAYDHPIGANPTAHRSFEGTVAGWNNGANRHVECEDCHNPHAATAGVTDWPTNAAKRTDNVAPPVSGSLKGVWGVDVNGGSGSSDWTGGATTTGTPIAPTYTRLATSGFQWQLCLKCHSVYAWSGGTIPTVSFNLASQTGGKQTDIGTDFSPKNYAMHPIFTRGKNQPATNLNANWASSAGRRNDLGTTGGLSNTFTDGWLSTSRVTCTDCHNNSDPTGVAGVHGSANEWILKGRDPNIKVTIAGGTVTYPNANSFAGNFCVNCHRGDVYDTPAAVAPTYNNLSRITHGVAFHAAASQCGGVSYLKTVNNYASCLNCHGGRKDTSSYGSPASTVVQSGAMHGTSMAAGSAGGDAMGYRFMNGASWSGHQLGASSGTVGCATLSAPGDTYSGCSNHPLLTSHPFTPTYYYQVQ